MTSLRSRTQRPRILVFLAALAVPACSGRTQDGNRGDNSNVTSADGGVGIVNGGVGGGSDAGGPGWAPSAGGTVVVGGVGEAGVSRGGDHADGPLVASGAVDAGASCGSLTFVDPTGALPLNGQPICSRGQSYIGCAAGTGASNSAIIGPSGGTLDLQGAIGTFKMTFPANAVSTPTQITVTELAVPPPSGFADWSPIYRVDPVDLALAAPATLQIPTGNSCCPTTPQGPGGCAAWGSLFMGLFWSGSERCTLERLSDSYVNAGFEQGSTTRLGFAIVGFASTGGATYCQ